MSKTAGFTFIEMLIVLSAFFTLSLITLFFLNPQNDLQVKNSFLSQFESDLLFAQQYAISHQQETIVHIMPERKIYYIRSGAYSVSSLVERNIPDEVKITKGSMELYFKYLPDGNVNQFGSIYFEVANRKYKLMILLGKGRFYVTEE